MYRHSWSFDSAQIALPLPIITRSFKRIVSVLAVYIANAHELREGH